MDLYTLGEKKVALYAVIPDNDNTFNFLVSLLYAQAFQALYYSADQIHHGPLPRHVRFVLDEFAAMPLPGFTRELATMRSRSISASVIKKARCPGALGVSRYTLGIDGLSVTTTAALPLRQVIRGLDMRK